MRNLLMALVVVGLVAAPSLGVINVKLVADKTTLAPGETATVSIYGQADSGLYALGCDILASGTAGALTSNAGTMVFDPAFIPTSLYTAKPGTAGTNGAWSNIGSLQASWSTPDNTLGATPAWALFSKFTVTGVAQGDVTLSFSGKTVSGFKPTEVNKAVALGTLTPLTLSVTPEPMTMVLLALGSLVVVRRRR